MVDWTFVMAIKLISDNKLPAKLAGIVTPFKGNGRRIGFPTANFKTDTELRDGVYFGWANLSKFTHNPAMIFIGTPTTLWDVGRRVEVFLLDIPDKDYYGKEVSIEIAHFHRTNKTFTTVEALVEAIEEDEQTARGWFGISRT
jgi:riboflavin kinase/FMN adenylyltransferase